MIRSEEIREGIWYHGIIRALATALGDLCIR